jgi:hypothetical protein
MSANVSIEAGEYATSQWKISGRYEIDTCAVFIAASVGLVLTPSKDSGHNSFSRKEFVETKEVLMERSKELTEKGKEGLYESYVKPYRHV